MTERDFQYRYRKPNDEDYVDGYREGVAHYAAHISVLKPTNIYSEWRKFAQGRSIEGIMAGDVVAFVNELFNKLR